MPPHSEDGSAKVLAALMAFSISSWCSVSPSYRTPCLVKMIS